MRTIDLLKYKLVTLDYPNILAEWELRHGEDPTISIEPKLKELVVALALKYPNWTLVANRFWRNIDGTGTEQARKFTIYEGSEALGEITTDYGNRSDERVFSISNERIASARERGHAVKTKDLAKAMKTVAKMFFTKNLSEHIAEADNNVRSLVANVTSDRYRTFERKFQHLAEHLKHYSVQHFDALRDIAIRAGADASYFDNYIEAFNEAVATEEIERCYGKNKGWVVLIRGNDYAVTSSNTRDQVTMYTTDTLPPHIKRGVGMLKLLDDNTFISGIGVRKSESTFFVMDNSND
jgi:hypothetical protein